MLINERNELHTTCEQTGESDCRGDHEQTTRGGAAAQVGRGSGAASPPWGLHERQRLEPGAQAIRRTVITHSNPTRRSPNEIQGDSPQYVPVMSNLLVQLTNLQTRE